MSSTLIDPYFDPILMNVWANDLKPSPSMRTNVLISNAQHMTTESVISVLIAFLLWFVDFFDKYFSILCWLSFSILHLCNNIVLVPKVFLWFNDSSRFIKRIKSVFSLNETLRKSFHFWFFPYVISKEMSKDLVLMSSIILDLLISDNSTFVSLELDIILII
jgi:hypothetical protein